MLVRPLLGVFPLFCGVLGSPRIPSESHRFYRVPERFLGLPRSIIVSGFNRFLLPELGVFLRGGFYKFQSGLKNAVAPCRKSILAPKPVKKVKFRRKSVRKVKKISKISEIWKKLNTGLGRSKVYGPSGKKVKFRKKKCRKSQILQGKCPEIVITL